MGCICCYAGKIMTEDKSCVEHRLFYNYCFYKTLVSSVARCLQVAFKRRCCTELNVALSHLFSCTAAIKKCKMS